ARPRHPLPPWRRPAPPPASPQAAGCAGPAEAGPATRSASVIGLLASHPSLTLGLLVPAILGVVLLIYLTVRYAPIIGQKFEEPPLFLPLRVGPSERGEPVSFPTADGFTLAGTYLRARTVRRAAAAVY